MIKRPQILPNIVILEKEDEKKWTDVIFKEVMIDPNAITLQNKYSSACFLTEDGEQTQKNQYL